MLGLLSVSRKASAFGVVVFCVRCSGFGIQPAGPWGRCNVRWRYVHQRTDRSSGIGIPDGTFPGGFPPLRTNVPRKVAPRHIGANHSHWTVTLIVCRLFSTLVSPVTGTTSPVMKYSPGFVRLGTLNESVPLICCPASTVARIFGFPI